MQINDIQLIGQLADLKDTDYKNTLALSVLIELLIDKGFFTRKEFIQKSWNVEKATLAEITAKRRFEGLHVLDMDSK